jgi:hypothetical protein
VSADVCGQCARHASGSCDVDDCYNYYYDVRAKCLQPEDPAHRCGFPAPALGKSPDCETALQLLHDNAESCSFGVSMSLLDEASWVNTFGLFSSSVVDPQTLTQAYAPYARPNVK